ncbi:MAG: hypothetical protein N3A54_05315 [Patescibacteria group bacterium]|nr:hypothetical protein [Patescibacteria group bacterium]
MVQVLFFMKYFGHFLLNEVYNLPVFYRNKMLEMLNERLEKENGNGSEVEKASGVDLNESQKKFLQDQERVKELLNQSIVKNTVPDNFVDPRINFRSILK